MQRAAEIRCGLPWMRIAHALGTLKAVRYRCERRTIVQRTKIAAELSAMLKTLGRSVPKDPRRRRGAPGGRNGLGTRPESACRKLLKDHRNFSRVPHDREHGFWRLLRFIRKFDSPGIRAGGGTAHGPTLFPAEDSRG